MKGTEVPNPQRSSACDCTCVLTRIDQIDHCLVTLPCLPCAFCCLVIFSFPSWFHSFLSQITLCFSFGSKDMITAFTCLPSHKHSSFTLRAYLCWRHIYCQWPIIELAMNVSPPLATWSRFIRMRVFRGVKKRPTYRVAVCRTNRKRSGFATKHFQRKSLKIFDFHPPPRRLVSFVAWIYI